MIRPPQPPTPPPDAFEIKRAPVAEDMDLAYIREGVGGYPLLLIHGYPETKRIWWRNIAPLAAAGFEVIVPDLRGYGDSGISETDNYELGLYSLDLYSLVHDTLGHEQVGLVAGDVGGVVSVDMANRYPGWVSRMIFFNTVAPFVVDQTDWYTDRGLSLNPLPHGPTGDYRIRQGRDHGQLKAELDTPERCERYVRDFYEHRLLSSQYAFEEDDYGFMTAPFRDLRRLAAGWAPYQHEFGRPLNVMPLIGECQVETMILHGPDDQIVPQDFAKRCELAFPNRVGPLVVPECGHFLQWERADVLNDMTTLFFQEFNQ